MFRFTIRDVLWLTVVVGLACGWWIYARAMNAENATYRRELEIYNFESKTGQQLRYP
jgi:hypothetical protein